MTIATAASTVRRPTRYRRPRRRSREPLPKPRQLRLLQRIAHWLLSCQVPVAGGAQ